MTQVIIHIHSEYDKSKERIIDYIGSLRLQVLCTHDRLALLRARRIKVGIKNANQNSIKYIDGEKINCYSDIKPKMETLEWCYKSGFNLCSVCYLLACLIAQCYRTKQHLEILRLGKVPLNKLTEYLLKIEGIFDNNFGIWQIMQYDIALAMMDNGQVISFDDFCTRAKEKLCFIQLFDFYLTIADYGRRTQELDLIIVLYDFYYFLEEITYPSALKKLVSHVYTSVLRKGLFLYVKKIRFDTENSMEEEVLTEEVQTEGTITERPIKSDLEKAMELKKYLYTTYPLNKEKIKKQKRDERRKQLFMPYYDIAIQPISSYVVMEGLREEYKTL